MTMKISANGTVRTFTNADKGQTPREFLQNNGYEVNEGFTCMFNGENIDTMMDITIKNQPSYQHHENQMALITRKMNAREVM